MAASWNVTPCFLEFGLLVVPFDDHDDSLYAHVLGLANTGDQLRGPRCLAIAALVCIALLDRCSPQGALRDHV